MRNALFILAFLFMAGQLPAMNKTAAEETVETGFQKPKPPPAPKKNKKPPAPKKPSKPKAPKPAKKPATPPKPPGF